MPEKLIAFGLTAVLNDEYVLLFGGQTNGKLHDDIWIYSVRDEKFKRSNLKCPRKGEFEAITVCDKVKDEVITTGFVRGQWRLCGIGDHLFPPQYLIKLMNSYYLNEFIHLFGCWSGEHWKINVFDIVPSTHCVK